MVWGWAWGWCRALHGCLVCVGSPDDTWHVVGDRRAGVVGWRVETVSWVPGSSPWVPG